MSEITLIPIEQININPLNPRKFVDDNALQELAESIKGVGIIQPILIRPNGKPGMYEIVYGERRYRAASIAGLTEVPCTIETLDDRQTLEYMITENMQRADILPMEEAEAFKTLADLGYTLDDLVAKFGKNARYIRLRLKLNDLIKDFQNLLLTQVIGVGHAQEICRLSEANQKEYFKSRFAQRGQWWSCPSVGELKKEIGRNFLMDLSKASFDPKDEKLVKKAGACTVCPKNTAADIILFPDMPVTGICLDRVCFKKKLDTHFKHVLKDITENEPDTMLCRPRWLNAEDTEIVEGYKKEGLKIESPDMENIWEYLHTPEPPDPIDEYDLDEEESLEEAKQDYENAMKEYQEDLAKFELRTKDPATMKCLMVVGDGRGEIFYIVKKGSSKGKGKDKKADKKAEKVTIEALQQKIESLKQKDARNHEIFMEKIYDDGQDEFAKKKYYTEHKDLTSLEVGALYYFMSQESFAGGRKKLSIKEAMEISAEETNKLCRNFIQTKMLGKGKFNKEILSLFSQIFEEQYLDDFEKVKAPHLGVLNKRIDSIVNRIKEMVKAVNLMKNNVTKEDLKPKAEKSEAKDKKSVKKPAKKTAKKKK